MSDSLREQMLKAGFKDTAASNNKKRSSKPQANRNKSGKHKTNAAARAQNNNTGPSSLERANIAEREAIAERKRIKAEIKAIIEADKAEDTKGELVHSYLVGKRIKQMFVNEAVREKLVAGTLVITRLNGATYLIPAETGERVCTLNPDWVVIKPGDEPLAEGNDEYADYKVPDDLTW